MSLQWWTSWAQTTPNNIKSTKLRVLSTKNGVQPLLVVFIHEQMKTSKQRSQQKTKWNKNKTKYVYPFVRKIQPVELPFSQQTDSANNIWAHNSDQCKTRALKKKCQQQEGTNHKLPQADKGLHQKVSGDVFRHYNSGRWIYLWFILANPTNRTSQQHLNAKIRSAQNKSFDKNTDQQEGPNNKLYTISWRRSASESKRRCLSSLQFSPLNLSVVHSSLQTQQTDSVNIRTHKSQCKTKASKNTDQQQEGTNQKLPMDHKLTKVCIRK